jgi:macrolide transport system ATP-binding/permease protein
MKIIEINGVNKVFGAGSNVCYALKDVSLAIDQGDFVAIIGQSGSGKSTLMNLIGCLDTPTSGSYKIHGREVAALNKNEQAKLRCQTFGFIFQRYNLLGSLTAAGNVALPAIYWGLPAAARRQRADELLLDLEISDKTSNNPNQLSGGQQQRVSIARALMNGGEIILADEPTGALDSASGEMVMNIIKNLHRRGHTIITVTHDKNIAAKASRIIEIKDGEIRADTRNNAEIYANHEKKISPPKSRFAHFQYQLGESFRMALQALAAHKMRSLLTMLGIIIGITSVVTVIALGNGSKEKIMSNVSSLGANTILIVPGAGFGDRSAGKIKTLKARDAKILAGLSYVNSVSPNVSSSGLLVYQQQAKFSQLTGVSAEFLEVNNKQLSRGRRFNAAEVAGAASVVIIDHNTKNQLFGESVDQLNQIIIFNKQPLKIIGVMAWEDNFGPPQTGLNLYIPYTTAMYKILGSQEIASITVRVADHVNSHLAEDNLIRVLTALHEKKDFFTINSDSVRKAVENIADIMTLLISCISAIALIVGGIGVMNIMLVAVTERTREIGIRMAIGAKQSDIMQQFLIEAVLICLIGGVIGVSLSVLLGIGFNRFVTDFRMVLSWSSVAVALLCSSAIGIIFGFMPAKNAAHLNPIDALSRD